MYGNVKVYNYGVNDDLHAYVKRDCLPTECPRYEYRNSQAKSALPTGDTVMKTEPIQFSGKASEYFGIWISNLFLTIISLGIYSAWAKVRREAYFKNRTRILGNSFQYHATGGQLLKGRLIVLGTYIALNVVSVFAPIMGGLLAIGLLLLIPWAINSSQKFSARMTSYRNVRFNWHGTYLRSLWFFIIAPILGIISLGLLTPLIAKNYYGYFAKSFAFGTTNFSCADLKTSDFYSAWAICVLLPIFILLALIGMGAVVAQTESPEPGLLAVAVAVFIFYFYIILMGLVFPTMCRNVLLKNLELSDQCRFSSSLKPTTFTWIAISNILATICTLGLLLPWAKVRVYKYLCENTGLVIIGNLEEFVDEETPKRSSFGEEFADFEGLDVGL